MAVDRSGIGACSIVLGTARGDMLGFDFHIDGAFDASAIIDDEARGANITDDIAVSYTHLTLPTKRIV